MRINGSAIDGASVLDAPDLSPFDADVSPPPGPAGTTLSFQVNQTDTTVWALNGKPFEEPNTAIIHGERSSGWTADTTYHLPWNTTVDIILNVSNRSMDQVGPPQWHDPCPWHLRRTDGPSVAPSRPQILGTRLRYRLVSVRFGHRSIAGCD